MISFTSYEKNTEKTAKTLSASCPEYYDDIFEIVSSFSEFDSGEFAFSLFSDFLLIRIFEGEMYTFVYPIPLCDGVCEKEALSELRLYAIKEEIPLIICDVPEEARETLEEAFRFTEIHEDGEALFAFIKSEISMYGEIPESNDGVLTLSALTEDDIPVYSEISKNEELNRFWGYDYREDIKNPDDEYFYLTAKQGISDGTSLTLGVRYNGKLIGEGLFWGFDLLGGCEVGFRILPEWQGRGFGKRTLKLLIKTAEEIGLINLYATVKKENTRSVGLVSSLMEKYDERDGVYKYILKL